VSGLPPDPRRIADLIAADTESWMGTDERVLEWAGRIAANGTGLAILSNMPESFRTPLVARHSSWLARFPVRIFSCDVGFAKPDAEIYALLLSRLGAAGDRVLFIDDNRVNIDGARRAGLRTIHYTSIDALDGRLLSELGLPPVLP
jgi:putative hydrolase of the HAD superfamily